MWDGHQFHRPTSVTTAGTISVRVMNVSINTPTATAKPSCNRSWSGSVISAENVPARMIPAEVMTGPRPCERIAGRLSERCYPRLLPDSRHQVDVVVDAQRVQEHEQVERDRRTNTGMPREDDEHHDCESKRRKVGERDGGHQVERRYERA